MKIISSAKSLQKLITGLKLRKKSVGFVPTMGALHEGHLSLVRRCRKENDITVVSIFVNPKQFGPKEDLACYPREEKKDQILLKKEKIDILFRPSVEEVYPKNYLTFVDVQEYDTHLCGRLRPGHFKGVATVVCKLLNIVLPDQIYLGQKDAQQVVILKKMIADLNFLVQTKVCPTVREKDGLAMSSRNLYLNQQERQEAPILYQAIKEAQKNIHSGLRQSSKIIQKIKHTIQKNSSGMINYIECVDAQNLKPLHIIKGRVLIALSVSFRSTQLIDNIIVTI